MNSQVKCLKAQLKILKKDIQAKKAQRKQSPDGFIRYLADVRYVYRHMHIAYCLLRGTPYEKIEPSVRENNAPCQVYINYWRAQALLDDYIPLRDYTRIVAPAISAPPSFVFPTNYNRTAEKILGIEEDPRQPKEEETEEYESIVRKAIKRWGW